MKTIISLTSIPSRFPSLGPTLSSLVAQGADEVRLYIPTAYRRFPAWDGHLPDVPDGVQIVRCAEDLGPATKVLPAVRDFQGQDVQILFCDDDCILPKDWAPKLFRVQRKHSENVVAVYARPAYLERRLPIDLPYAWQIPLKYDFPYRFMRLMHKLFHVSPPKRRPFWISGYGDVFFGAGGVVVRPHFFDESDYQIPEVAWFVDDVWLSAAVARKSIKIYCPAFFPLPGTNESTAVDALLDFTQAGVGRDESNHNASKYCRDKFGIWK